MIIKKISKSNIMATLSETELEAYGITIYDFVHRPPSKKEKIAEVTFNLIEDILISQNMVKRGETVPLTVKFDFTDSSITLNIFIGYELMGLDSVIPVENTSIENEKKMPVVNTYMIEMDYMSEVINISNTLISLSEKESSLFKMNDKYYLNLKIKNNKLKYFNLIISEFNINPLINNSNRICYIEEHGELIFLKNAINELVSL